MEADFISNKVSIIIPCYNRADLISETLDSIIAQTYSNWECIIVDDGSLDNFEEIIKPYVAKDSRFQLHYRPENYPKGANACRNLGLKLAKGEYVIFFDSDDLMTEDHIRLKINGIESRDYDILVARSKYFNNPDNINPINYRQLGELPITATNFITKKIGWVTFDPIIKSKIAKKVKFTEKNNSAEEYNYFAKLLLETNKTATINKYVTLRRYHKSSIQGRLIQDKKETEKNSFYYYWDTYQEIYQKVDIESKIFLLNQCIEILYRSIKKIQFNKLDFIKSLIREKGIIKAIKNYMILKFRNKI